jgi:hypothetical protein
MIGFIICARGQIFLSEFKRFLSKENEDALVVATRNTDTVRAKQIARALSLPFLFLPTQSAFSRAARNWNFSICEGSRGAFFSVFSYTPCYLNVKMQENLPAFMSLYTLFGKAAVLPYFPSQIEKIKPEFSKSELEKLLLNFDFLSLTPRLKALKAFPFQERFPTERFLKP